MSCYFSNVRGYALKCSLFWDLFPVMYQRATKWSEVCEWANLFSHESVYRATKRPNSRSLKNRLTYSRYIMEVQSWRGWQNDPMVNDCVLPDPTTRGPCPADGWSWPWRLTWKRAKRRRGRKKTPQPFKGWLEDGGLSFHSEVELGATSIMFVSRKLNYELRAMWQFKQTSTHSFTDQVLDTFLLLDKQ